MRVISSLVDRVLKSIIVIPLFLSEFMAKRLQSVIVRNAIGFRVEFGKSIWRRMGMVSKKADLKQNKGALICLVVLAIALVFAMAVCCSCSNQEKSVYDWSQLRREDGRFTYLDKKGETSSRLGIDVSENQGSIDWNQVANDGISFAFARAGYRGDSEGGLYTDDSFAQNIDGAAKAGLDVGVYFFSQAINEDEAREEAEFCLEQIGGRQLDCPVAYDFELGQSPEGSRAQDISSEQISANAEAFCEVIEAAGYDACIYGNPTDLESYTDKVLKKYGIWYAEYALIPSLERRVLYWQYTNEGEVAGIDTAVDIDIEIFID